MNKISLIILVLICSLCIIGICFILFKNVQDENKNLRSVLSENERLKKGPVESKQEAIEIAKRYVKEKYKRSFEDYQIKVVIESELDADGSDDVWVVSYSYIDKFGYAVEGGGGPEVHIRKTDGKIIYCMLQQ